MKPSFINNAHPLNTCMVQAKTVERSIELFRAGLADGCDAFGFQYEKLIADDNKDLCLKYGVKGAPTLVITNGENHVNYYSVPEIKKYLASL